MATIESNSNKIEVKDGSDITNACEKLGVVFGCYAGTCGSCKIQVEEGLDNLNQLTQEEIDMDLDDNQRLACQSKINQGNTKIKF